MPACYAVLEARARMHVHDAMGPRMSWGTMVDRDKYALEWQCFFVPIFHWFTSECMMASMHISLESLVNVSPNGSQAKLK